MIEEGYAKLALNRASRRQDPNAQVPKGQRSDGSEAVARMGELAALSTTLLKYAFQGNQP